MYIENQQFSWLLIRKYLSVNDGWNTNLLNLIELVIKNREGKKQWKVRRQVPWNSTEVKAKTEPVYLLSPTKGKLYQEHEHGYQHRHNHKITPRWAQGRGRDDLDREKAAPLGDILCGDRCQALEVAAQPVLVIYLEVHVEGVGGIRTCVQVVARGAVHQGRAVRESAGIVDVVPELAQVVGVGVQHAPLVREILHVFCRNRHLVLALPRDIQRKLRSPVVPVCKIRVTSL